MERKEEGIDKVIDREERGRHTYGYMMERKEECKVNIRIEEEGK